MWTSGTVPVDASSAQPNFYKKMSIKIMKIFFQVSQIVKIHLRILCLKAILYCSVFILNCYLRFPLIPESCFCP